MPKENFKNFLAIIKDWDFFNFLRDKHYQTQIVEKLGIDKRHVRDKLQTYKKQGLIKKVEKKGRQTYYLDTDETLDIIRYLVVYEYRNISEGKIATKEELIPIFKNLQNKDIILYKDAIRDFELICKKKKIILNEDQIKKLKEVLSNNKPELQEGKEDLLQGLLNISEKLKQKGEFDHINNIFKNFNEILRNMCIYGVPNAKNNEIVSCRCRHRSISILLILNEDVGLNTIFDMVEKIPEKEYNGGSNLETRLCKELENLAQKNKKYRDEIKKQLNNLLKNPNKIIQKRAEIIKSLLRDNLY